jgi:hypothetical protein
MPSGQRTAIMNLRQFSKSLKILDGLLEGFRAFHAQEINSQSSILLPVQTLCFQDRWGEGVLGF